MDEFLTIEFLGNSLQDYTWFIIQFNRINF